MHGHQFESVLERHPLVTASAGLLYSTLQRWETESHPITRLVKCTSKVWRRISDLVAQEAAEYAVRRGADGIFCGHTHSPMEKMFGNVTYYNTGCWTEKPATFITVGPRGIRLEECP